MCGCVFLEFISIQKMVAGELELLQQRKQLLQNQVQTLAREQQHLANQLARNGVHQVENSAKQLKLAQAVQMVAANVLATKGLNDVNIQFRIAFGCYIQMDDGSHSTKSN